MAKNTVSITGVDTKKLKVLTNEEMVELFKKMQTGDKFARDDLVNGNLKLVLSILRKFYNKSDDLDDLFQIGCIGLVKSIDNFDLSHNVRFSTYAVPMILGEIRRYLRDNNSVRVARSIKDTAYKALKLKEELMQQLNREPTTKELSEKLEIDEFEIVNAIDAMRNPVSIFEPIYNDGGDAIYLADQLEDKKKKSSDWDLKISLNRGLEILKDREKNILLDRFIFGKTQMEIAEEIGISQAQVSRLETNAVKTLKKILK